MPRAEFSVNVSEQCTRSPCRVPDVEGRGRPQAVLAWVSPRLRGSSMNAHGNGQNPIRPSAHTPATASARRGKPDLEGPCRDTGIMIMIQGSDITHWLPRSTEGEETAAAQQRLGRESGPNPSQCQCNAASECHYNNHSAGESLSHCTGKPEFPAARRARAEYGSRSVTVTHVRCGHHGSQTPGRPQACRRPGEIT